MIILPEDSNLEHLFIVNPAAGKKKALHMAEYIKERFENTSLNWRIVTTWNPGHATVLAREAVANQPDIHIYSVGGDGTLNEIINGIAGTNAPLGIIPCGSGNDAIRSITSVKDPVLLLESLIDARIEKTDLGKLNDKWFLNIASVGFDAEVVRLTTRFKNLPLVSGSMAYILGVLSALIKNKTYPISICIDDGEPINTTLLLAAFANGKFYGGGMQPAPNANLQDGHLDSCIVQPLTRRKILNFFPLFTKGKHGSLKEVELSTFKKIHIEMQNVFPLQLVAESVGSHSNKEIRIRPKLSSEFIDSTILDGDVHSDENLKNMLNNITESDKELVNTTKHDLHSDMKLTTSMKLSNELLLPINIDGELMFTKTIDVSIHPGALMLKYP